MAASETPQPVRWTRVLALLAAGFVVLEIASQLVIFHFAGQPFQSLSSYKWSPYGLVRNNPKLTSPAFEINQNGFRAITDYEKAKPPGVLRIILLGGSALYSGIVPGAARLNKYGRVSSSQTIATHLEEKLNQDIDFRGRRFEVINAAVNFNRIIEVSAAYLEEYLHWQPDLVIVYGSINNFGNFRSKGQVGEARTELQSAHPWRREFELIVNDNGFASFLERSWRTGAESSAFLALALKLSTSIVDRAVNTIKVRRPRSTGALERPESETDTERAMYFQIYGSYANAIVAAARQSEQEIAFAWEPLLGTLDGVKPLSPDEKSIFPLVRQSADMVEQFEKSRIDFNRHFERAGVIVIDPTQDLRTTTETVFIDYGHYTPEGNRFFAEVAHKRLKPRLLVMAAGGKSSTTTSDSK